MNKPLLAPALILFLAGCHLWQPTTEPSCPFDQGNLLIPPMIQLGVSGATGASSWESFSVKFSKAEFISDGDEVAYPFQSEAHELLKGTNGFYGRAMPIQSESFSKVRLTIDAVTGILREGSGTRSVSVQTTSPLTIAQGFTTEGSKRTVLRLSLDLSALVVESSESFRIPEQAVTLIASDQPTEYSPEGFTNTWIDCSQHLNLASGSVTQEDAADLKISPNDNQPAFQGFGAIADLGSIPLSEVHRAPQSGFTNITRAIEGHSYVVRTREGRYAKLYLAHLLKLKDRYAAWVEYYLQKDGSERFSK